MMIKNLVLGFVLLCSSFSFAKTEKWVIDSAHTKVGFEISHLIISSVEGRFSDFSGSIEFDSKNPKQGKLFKINATVDAKSVNTGNDKRDKHLRSADFFDVKKFPKWSFKSSSFKSLDGKSFELKGVLTLAGKSKPVVFSAQYLGSAVAYDVERIAFTAKTTIKRADFGLTWNDGEVKSSNFAGKIAEAAGAIGEDVSIELKIQAKKASDL